MISGAAQADVCLLMVPADGNFTTAIQKGDHKAAEIQGQTRQHARLINLLGVKQLIVGVNKMDSDVAGYKEARYVEIRDEMRHMLARVGWKPDFVEKSVPILPISGWMGDNLITKSPNMGWWNGMEVKTIDNRTVKIECLLNALNDMVVVPERKTDAPMRVPISGAYKIKGVGDVLAGRVEQGIVKPGDEVGVALGGGEGCLGWARVASWVCICSWASRAITGLLLLWAAVFASGLWRAAVCLPFSS
jgi:elongation factor 1-alpha